MEHALRSFRLEGLTTNIPLLRTVLGDPTFRLATYDCTMLARLTGPRAGGRSVWSRHGGAEPAPVERGEDEGDNINEEFQELAAAAALALALSGVRPRARTAAPWRAAGRHIQMVNRIGARAPW
jgi:acetyl/propionyl-CoA carboxylase alpha subunit